MYSLTPAQIHAIFETIDFALEEQLYRIESGEIRKQFSDSPPKELEEYARSQALTWKQIAIAAQEMGFNEPRTLSFLDLSDKWQELAESLQ
jgi:hypothetical protein